MGKLSNICIKENKIILKINPEIYGLDVIYSAAYVFLDKAYILIDGDPKKEVIIELLPKNNKDLNTIGEEFNNELLNYATYKTYSLKNNDIRTMIIQRALITGDPKIVEQDEADDELDAETKKLLEELEKEDDTDWLDDPEGIAIPWEEKYGKNAKKKMKKSKDGRKNKAK